MIIGVDAGALSIRDKRLKVGVYRVTLHLLKELSNIDTKNDYRLYSFLPIDRKVMNEFGTNIQNIVVRPTFAWSAIQLPIELARHPVDVFLGLSQMLPITSAKKIGFVYDVGFLHYPDAYPGSLDRLKKQTILLTKRADYIVSISKTTQKDIVDFYGFPQNKITVSYPGIDTRFTLKGPTYKNTNPYFLFVGALKRGKNIPFMLKSFSEFLKTSKKQYDLLLIGGDYWLDPEIGNTIQALDLESRVKIKGFVTDEDLPSYYRGAQALLVTSFWEGFCLPAVEAMASGCPVLYTKTGSLREIVGYAGIMVSSLYPSYLAHAMKKVTEHTVREKLVTNGLTMTKRYDWHSFARTVYDVIYSV